MKIKYFLGFTDSLKEPFRSRVKKHLGKVRSYDGKVYTIKDFLCIKLLEGYVPEIGADDYRLMDRNENVYYLIGKIEYDFLCYLQRSGLTTEDAILQRDMHDEQLTLAKQQEEERKQKEIFAEQEKKQAEEEVMKQTICEEIYRISEEEKRIVDEIFIKRYGEVTSPMAYSIVVLIHHFDEPCFKEELIERLHNGNKASVAVFKKLTGLQLPRSYRERRKFLQGIDSSQFKGGRLE